ncbi:MAG: AAA-like domain-containing protein, partial [Limisphaerales bacterium]
MSNLSPSFFVTGGTLRPDAACYVERQADKDLYDGLTAGDFCYVLTSRQMGKSSLMVRTVQRLRADGRAVAVLDLTAIGQNLTVDQWYTGLLERAGSQLDLEDEFEDFVEENKSLGPAHRWFAAIREVALTSKDCEQGLVVFVDEIDSVRSLPFSTDEFFAAIRECFNRRSADPELAKLTFCLLGVATPSDLIRDTRTTPFNIGRRIELRDFTKREAVGLVGGLESQFSGDEAKILLDRVMYWTNGQPYLTQLFCRALAENTDVATVAKVDRLCETLFLDERAAEKNDNLVFVRERMLRSEVDRFELLNLYAKIHAGRCVRDDPGNPLVGVLRLSGIAREEKGFLQIRSPIYSRVFNRKWVRHNFPDAEVRRQRKAYRQGVIRSGVWALCILAVIAYFWVKAHEQAMRADQSATSEAFARGAAELAQKKAEVAAREVQEVLSQMELRQAEEMFRLGRSSTAVAYLAHLLVSNPTNRLAAQRLVYALSQRNFAMPIHENERSPGDQVVPPPAPPEIRIDIQRTNETVALIYRRRASKPIAKIQHDGYIIESDISPDNQTVATAAMDDTARLWNAETGELLTPPLKHDGPVTSAKFSPDGKLLATAAADHTVRIWDVATGRLVNEPLMHAGSVGTIQFDRSGHHLFTRMRRGRGRGRNHYRLWDLRPGNLRVPALPHESPVRFVRIVGNDGLVLTAAHDNVVRLWNAETGKPFGSTMAH